MSAPAGAIRMASSFEDLASAAAKATWSAARPVPLARAITRMPSSSAKAACSAIAVSRTMMKKALGNAWPRVFSRIISTMS
jgi:hypothetical protein